MIVNHRTKAVGTETEYTMAMHKTDFIVLHELLRIKLAELDQIPGARDTDLYALLYVMEATMHYST